MEFNNPALRLFNLLNQLKRANPNRSTSEALSNAFGVQNNPREIFRAVVEFQTLVNDVVAFSTTKTNLPSAPLMRYVPQIQSAVEFTNLDAQWSNYVNRITDQCLVVLEMVAHVESVPQDTQASDETIADLKVALDALFEHVMLDKQLDKEFKIFVLEQIENIRRCLAEYRISGPQGFVKYLERFVGQVAGSAEVIRREKKRNPQSVSLFGNVLGKVKTFAELTGSGVKLIKGIREFQSESAGLLENFTASSSDENPELNTTDIA